MRKKRMILCGVACIAVFLFAACSASPMAVSAPAAAPAAAPPMMAGGQGMGTGAAESGEPAMDNSAAGAPAVGNHKIIFDAQVSLETKTFDEDEQYLIGRIKAVGGYVANSARYGKTPETFRDGGRSLEITARIPQEQFDVFLEDAKGRGKLVSLNVGSQDITEEYFDIETRISTARIHLERLENILVQTTRLSDMIELESEIARVRTELEQLTTQQRKWDNLIAYATVTIYIQELPLDQPISDDANLGRRMSSGFTSVLNGVVHFGEDFLVLVISALPVLIILGIIALIMILAVRARLKKKKNRPAPPQYPPPPHAPAYGQAPLPPLPPQNKKE